MSKQEQVRNILFSQKLLPLFYDDSAEVSIAILKALYKGGVRIIEYTNRGDKALKNFAALRKQVDKSNPDLQLGIGTIKTKKAAKEFIKAGADFIVCPSINAEVGEFVQKENILWIPGCMTPTEIASAENAGAGIVKIFPGNLLGPAYISAIKDLFPNLKFVVTGGVEAEEKNLREWFASGVVGVGMGSKLISKDIIQNKAFGQLESAAERVLQMIGEASQVRN